jgi:hypothetical protein
MEKYENWAVISRYKEQKLPRIYKKPLKFNLCRLLFLNCRQNSYIYKPPSVPRNIEKREGNAYRRL